MSFKRMTKKTEFYVALILIAFCLIIQVRSGQFFTPNNIVDQLRSLTIPMMFAMGEMMVLISGGVDCSFPAIASLSMYFVCTKLDGVFSNPIPYFLIAMALGLVMGAVPASETRQAIWPFFTCHTWLTREDTAVFCHLVLPPVYTMTRTLSPYLAAAIS